MIHAGEIRWILQLPEGFTRWNLAKAQKSYRLSVKLMGDYGEGSVYHASNSKALFTAEFNQFNRISGSIANIRGFTGEQIQATREDCKGKLTQFFSRIPQSRIERSNATCTIGGISFEQHSFLIIRNGKPILCYDYVCQIIGDYELSVALSYNNETRRQELFESLQQSHFTP